MGILDEAIKEHLELKRQHGAGEMELKELEDEAFGASERPGGEPGGEQPSEAPTQFMSQPGEGDEQRSAREEAAARVAELQEAPPAPAEEDEGEEPAAELEPLEEQQAAEHQVVPAAEGGSEPEGESEPAADEEMAADEPAASSTGPSTEERQAIAEQPTEMYDVEEQMAPSEGDDEDDEFWNEQRLSDELDQALEAPLDSEKEEEPPAPEQRAAEDEAAVGEQSGEEGKSERDDVLEKTPDFLEETPEDDELWFEQKPPKDFDFDD